ncbi:MAG TPA: hypothetical protein VN448_10205 [Gammaproteobacteria bacterium]|jgi:hypothetical protein|nr:hypothetical protein [Gammaproteobacteria bacterium]
METSGRSRHQIIQSLTEQNTGNVAATAINQWELMAAQIISIVGEGGFNALYLRSAFLASSIFPWLATPSLSIQVDDRFANLRTSLEGQTPEQASAANGLLLITFSDILASLIGEDLTTRILRSAWDIDAPSQAGKEFNHE